jgi:hypothetical protein
MGDYGFRVSRKGKDVFNDGDLDMSLTSKYANLKGAIKGQGSVDISGETKTITVNHSLNYVPFAQVYIYEEDNYGRYLPYRDAIISLNNVQVWEYWYYCDVDNLYIKLYTTKSLTIYYTYWIYYDKGRLI